MAKLDALADGLHEKTGYPKTHIKQILTHFGDELINVLKKEGEVKIWGVGTISVKMRGARAYHNPQTGEKVDRPDTPIIRFKVAPSLKKSIKA
jgi:DNA-binding protein HU-beta